MVRDPKGNSGNGGTAPLRKEAALSFDDFDYFGPPKCFSNVWSRQRLETKQRLLRFAEELAASFQVRERGLEVGSSDHFPSLWNRKCVDRQWVFFSRGKEAKRIVEEVIDLDKTLSATVADPTPYFKNIFLAIEMNATSVNVAVYLHWNAWVDRDNLLHGLEEPSWRERWMELMKSLHDEYLVKVDGADPVAAVELSDAKVDSLVEAFRSSMGFWSVGLFIPQKQAIALGEEVWEVLKVAFMLLLPIYEMVAWSPDNDFISMSEKQQQVKERRLELAREHEREVGEFIARREKGKLEWKQQREQLQQEVRNREVEPRPQQVRSEQLRPNVLAPAAEGRKGRVQPFFRRPPEADAPVIEKPLKYGDRVKIVGGLFRGKHGIVQEVDGRGNIKVILGSWVARIPLSDVRPY